MKKLGKQLMVSALALAMVVGMLFANRTPASAESKEQLITCTEKEAYEKGYDYYRAWYIVNKGNLQDLIYEHYPAYQSLVYEKRNDLAYQTSVIEWRVMTFNLKEIAHSVQENAYCEAMLFNLLYDEESESFYRKNVDNSIDLIEEMDKNMKNVNFSIWKKLAKFSYDGQKIDRKASLKDLSLEERQALFQEISATKEISDAFAFFSDVVEVLDHAVTVGEFLDGLAKVQVLCGMNADMSRVLSRATKFTNNSAYQSSLFDFADILSGSLTEEEANCVFAGRKAGREFFSDTVDFVWGAIGKKNAAAQGIQIGSTVGKFLSNTLTGIDDQYNKFNELEVYCDMEWILNATIGDLIDEMNGSNGDAQTARELLTAYTMMQKMYNCSIECYESYLDKAYRAGFMNWLGCNQDKYHHGMQLAYYMRRNWNEMFEEDLAKADQAYKILADAETEADSDTYSNVQVKNTVQVPADIEEVHENFQANRQAHGIYVKDNKTITLTKDQEVFGCINIENGTLNLNGNHVIVYGDVFLNESCCLNVNGVLEIKGRLLQKGGSLNISGASSLTIEGAYEQQDGRMYNQGGSLSVGGSYTVGSLYENQEVNTRVRTYMTMSNAAKLVIKGDFVAYYLWACTMEEGTMSVWGNLNVWSSTHTLLSGKNGDSFSITMKGSDDLIISNIDNVNLTIENALSRRVEFRNTVAVDKLKSGNMTIHPDHLSFGGSVDGDLVIEGDMKLVCDYNANGHNLRVHGDVECAGGGYLLHDDTHGDLQIDGNLTTNAGSGLRIPKDSKVVIDGNYLQIEGNMYNGGGSLTIGGDYQIGKGYNAGVVSVWSENNGQISVGGNLYVTDNSNYSKLASGTMKIGGSLISKVSNLYAYVDYNFVLMGSEDVVVQNLKGGNLQIEHASKRSITFKEYVAFNQLQGDSMYITTEKLRCMGTFAADVTFAGDMNFYGDTDLGGHKVKIEGSLYQEYGSLVVNEGSLEVMGDFKIASPSSSEEEDEDADSYNGRIVMKYPDDYILVHKNMLVYTNSTCYLEDGILEIQGNFTQMHGRTDSFYATKKHVTKLSGTRLQRVKFADYPKSQFNKLILCQYKEQYLFYPETCWVSLEIYCDHSETRLEGFIEKTCLEDGYTGDLYCAFCGELLEKGHYVEATGHHIVNDPAVAPTCAAAGKTVGRHCDVCGKIYRTQEEIPALPHDMKDVLTPATSTANGRTDTLCNVCGGITKTKVIYAATNIKLSATKYTYDGSVKSPTLTVKDSKGNTISTDNYSVVKSTGRKYVGSYSYKVTFKNMYKGSKTLTFKINPKGTTLASLTARTGGFTANWNRQASQTSGYQLRYSRSSAMTSAKTVTISGNTVVSKKITGLTAKRTYYVQVRTYKTVNSVKYYSGWSSYKRITTR